MAFEYLMAWYMLTGQLEKFMQNLYRLDDFDYSEIPRHYEEAILMYMLKAKKTVDLRDYRISLESQQRFDGFGQLLSRYGGNKRAAMNKLAEYYSDSYFFYYLYR